MKDQQSQNEQQNGTQRERRPPSRAAATAVGILFLLLLALYVGLQVALTSPSFARWVSSALSRALHQEVAVGRVSLRGGTVLLERVAIRNGNALAGTLASARSIAISPEWGTLTGSSRTIDSIRISGLEVALAKDRNGAWNYAAMSRGLSGRKGTGKPGETVLRHLQIDDGTLRLPGIAVDRVSIAAENIATAGTMTAGIHARGTVFGGDAAVEARVRLGREPFAEAGVTAQPLLGQLLQGRSGSLDVGTQRGNLRLKGRWEHGRLTASGEMAAAGVRLRLRGGDVPVKGHLRFTAGYDSGSDRASLDDALLVINDLVKVSARGDVAHLRGERRFTAHVATAPLELSDLWLQVPKPLQKDFHPSGNLGSLQVRVSGGGHGIDSAQGSAVLRGVSAARGDKTLVAGVDVNASLEKKGDGWKLEGRLLQGGSASAVAVRDMAGDFEALFTPKLRLALFRVDDFTARVAGAPVSASAVYDPAEVPPFAVKGAASSISLPKVIRAFSGNGNISSGTASLAFTGSGTGVSDFRGGFSAKVAGLGGKAGSGDFSLAEGKSDGELLAVQGGWRASGTLSIKGAAGGGTTADGAVRYDVDTDHFALTNGTVHSSRGEVGFSRLSGNIPRREGQGAPLPLRLAFSGMRYRSGKIAAEDLTGKAELLLRQGVQRSWAEGGIEVSSLRLLLDGKPLGTAHGSVQVEDKRVAGDLAASLFGGNLAGRVELDSTGTSPAVRIRAAAKGIDAAGLSALAGKGGVRATAGKISADVEGSFNQRAGFSGTVAIGAEDMALAGTGKTIAGNVSVAAEADVAGNKVTLRRGTIAAGPAVLAVTGQLTEAFTAQRRGVFAATVSPTTLEALLDSFANILPRALQEASVRGTVSGSSHVTLQGKEVRVDGNATLAGAGMEIPSQKLVVADVRGTIPFSIMLPAATVRQQEGQHASRESYPQFLELIQYGPHRGSILKVGRVTFGALELGETTIQTDAADGLISVNSLVSSLAGGRLLGRGWYRPGTPAEFSGDLLVNDLSLRLLCAAFPAIKDYITGRIDGFVSVASAGGSKGRIGFFDMWAREVREEKMRVSKEFLQKLAGKNLKGIFFRNDRPYDRGEISGWLEKGYLTFDTLDISNTNFFGVRDLSVTVAPSQNSIALDHLTNAIKAAAARGKAVKGDGGEAPVDTEFKWQE